MTYKRSLASLSSAQAYTSLAVYLRLLKVSAPYWLSFVIGFFGTVLATGADSALAWAVKPLVDEGLIKRSHELLIWLPFIVVGIFALRSVTYFLSNYYLIRVGRNVVRDFRQKIFAHLMHLPAAFYDKESSGKLLSLIIYNTEQVATASTESLLTVLQEGMTLIGLTIVMFLISWQLTLLFMVTTPFISLIVRFNSRRLRMLSSNVQKTMGDVTQVAEEGIENYRVIRIFGGDEYEKNKFNTVTQLNRHREMKVVATNALGTSLVQIIASIAIALIIYIAILPSLHVTVGDFAALITAMLRILTPMKRLTKVNSEIQKGVAGAHSIFTLLDAEAEKDNGTQAIVRAKGKIAYQNVNFIYPRSHKQVLNEINFTVEPGQTVALVGRSGSGKSTLVSLLPRFYDVSSGAIVIDGHNVQDYKLSDLRKQFAFVSQHLSLFNDTIARNIAYGSLEEATEEKIIKAAKAAHLYEFVTGLPEGFNTPIGENGLLLSGGQRQRIAIARALLKDAPILILDEATSALDTESERHIQAALVELMRERTTLVIAHRLSTIESADKIMVMDHGRIVEIGSHKELLQLDGVYATLHRLQFKDEE
jgi:ATP-binding cassette, subfamily B, bacterial MsbA